MRRSKQGASEARCAALLKLPVVGTLLQAAIVERVCRVLASLVTAGVDLPRALAVTAESSNNAVYNEGINHIREQMMEGAGLAEPLAETGLFPAAARQMFRVGEETGTLDKQLSTAAAFYHRELELKVKHFTSLFEPAVIIFMGVIVGFVAVALVSAMYGIYRQVKISEILLQLSRDGRSEDFCRYPYDLNCLKTRTFECRTLASLIVRIDAHTIVVNMTDQLPGAE